MAVKGSRGFGVLLAASVVASMALFACGNGKTFSEVLQSIKGSSADDAAKVLSEADLAANERLAIDALCTSAETLNESVSDGGYSFDASDFTGIYADSVGVDALSKLAGAPDQLNTTLDLAQVNPGAASRYAQFCVAR